MTSENSFPIFSFFFYKSSCKLVLNVRLKLSISIHIEFRFIIQKIYKIERYAVSQFANTTKYFLTTQILANIDDI
jgi:hypothetical protein